ncbi:phosphoribosylpyrophosphate synthetase [Marispirochaeta aestuarii]|uniref:ribose-phosphate diphosphokinase n=1 Tax=Marispirochaeta aestuarii TaxID=1963862 RepID=A0A1Y1S2P2_9SPIO|nr:ribose-phosphate diphosphokinase [Marispirochaeta aestuarii]ORC38187.1 phosphoribosylpyrophosphate synthetase [Marispirochaeta aestuarii]
MSISKPGTLGIIACPGGASFARELLPHLRSIYARKYQRMATRLAKRYKIDKEKAIEQINFVQDLHIPSQNHGFFGEHYRPPSFEIPTRFTRFANGEFKAEILSSVRGIDLYVIQDVENHYPVPLNGEETTLSLNDHMFILFVTIDAAIQAGARSVTLVLPVYPYSRQHKRKGRESLTAAWFGRICEFMGVGRIITLDIHSREIQNTFHRTAIENLHASYQILRSLSRLVDLVHEDLVVVAPDTGAVDRNKFYAVSLHKPLALLYKERDYSKVSQAGDSNITSINLLGHVEGKTVFMADDMLGTGGTLIKAMTHLKEVGAEKIICAISLPLFTGRAIEEFDAAYQKGLFYRIIGTNAVYHDETLLEKEWFVSANIANLFSRIISRLHHGRSLSPLLDNRKIIQRLLSQVAAEGGEDELPFDREPSSREPGEKERGE